MASRAWFNKRWNDHKRNDIIFTECGNPNCDNEMIEITKYETEGVREGTPPERVHEVLQPRLQGVTIICSRCGDFTVLHG